MYGETGETVSHVVVEEDSGKKGEDKWWEENKWGIGGMEIGGDGSETGSVTKKG